MAVAVVAVASYATAMVPVATAVAVATEDSAAIVAARLFQCYGRHSYSCPSSHPRNCGS